MAKFSKISMEDTEEAMQSKINAAGLINANLENLWNQSYTAMANMDLLRWALKLDAIWVILGGDCIEDGDEYNKIKKFDEQLFSKGSLSHSTAGFGILNEKQRVIMAYQYLVLKNKSLYLRRLQNKQGKGTAYVSDDDDDM